jgi:hypothetical protein
MMKKKEIDVLITIVFVVLLVIGIIQLFQNYNDMFFGSKQWETSKGVRICGALYFLFFGLIEILSSSKLVNNSAILEYVSKLIGKKRSLLVGIITGLAGVLFFFW